MECPSLADRSGTGPGTVVMLWFEKQVSILATVTGFVLA